ncbi:uncharacterized protein RAG0_12621 [Rhynchosporium agropyri]|uniref:Hypervirulence associated protein TUDOR domain-containing protein n=2 Tax=Rhynchosporium TaxID=38037 RepID=A0A1E1MUE5_RHYSE|nr:uncharacterized protein RAG0_12621 [Rhynchosporium agropyri]CZT52679.1 uncharacterized protein RSE6_14034 [Rhynchosporium secalis]
MSPPANSYTKAYYVAGDDIWFQKPGDNEWTRGTVSSKTTSTLMPVCTEDATGNDYNVRSEHIRAAS